MKLQCQLAAHTKRSPDKFEPKHRKIDTNIAHFQTEDKRAHTSIYPKRCHMHSAWLGFLKGSAHINCNSDQVWVSRWLQTWHLLLLTSHMWCLQAKLEPRFTCEHCRKLAATTQAKKNTWWEILGHGTCRSRSVTVGHGWSRPRPFTFQVGRFLRSRLVTVGHGRWGP